MKFQLSFWIDMLLSYVTYNAEYNIHINTSNFS